MAVPRTTTLSGAFLRAAARGECSVSWHNLLGALGDGVEIRVATAASEVMAHGATSGADSLAGFLFLSKGERVCTGSQPVHTASMEMNVPISLAAT